MRPYFDHFLGTIVGDRILGWIDHGSVLEGHFYIKHCVNMSIITFLHLTKLLVHLLNKYIQQQPSSGFSAILSVESQ